MAYTPPAGNAVALHFTGDAYTPPPGNNIDFTFAIFGDGSVSLPLDALGVVGHGVSGQAATSDVVQAIGAAEVYVIGEALARLSLGVVADGQQPYYGNASGLLTLVAQGVATPASSGAVAISSIVDVVIIAHAYSPGVAAAEVSISATGVGGVPPIALGAAQCRLTATGAGLFPPQGNVAHPLRLSATGSGVAGRTGTGSGRLRLSASGSGKHGRVATASATLRLSATASARRGVTGAGSSTLPISCAGLGQVVKTYVGSGVATVPFSMLGDARYGAGGTLTDYDRVTVLVRSPVVSVLN